MPACSRTGAAARSRGNNFIDVLSTVYADQETRMLTFKKDAKALAAHWKLYYLNNPFSHSHTGRCASFQNQCSVQAVRGDLGELVTCMTLGSDLTLHRRHRSHSSASQAFHTIQEYKTECKVRKEPLWKVKMLMLSLLFGIPRHAFSVWRILSRDR